jgi:hypothetical protein
MPPLHRSDAAPYRFCKLSPNGCRLFETELSRGNLMGRVRNKVVSSVLFYEGRSFEP